MPIISTYANDASITSGVVHVSYTNSAFNGLNWIQYSVVQTTVAGVETAKMEDVLPTAKAISAEFKGSVKDFLEWLDTP